MGDVQMGHQEVLWALLSERLSVYNNFLSVENNLKVTSPQMEDI